MTAATINASAYSKPIKPRNRNHDLSESLKGEWFENDPFLTAFFNAMSITFPIGEKFFIDSVRHYRDDITDPKLLEDIRGFCGQEGFHRREHQRYNEALCEARGYDLEKLEGKMTRRLNWVQKKMPPLTNLAVTVAIEHFTAVLSESLLSEGSRMNNAEPAMRELWRWHAAEEMEHKAVAFDVYQQVGGTEKIRRRAMRRASFFLALELTGGLCYMLKKDGLLFKYSVWRQGLKKLFGKQGVFANTWVPYKEFYAKNFHPWQQDTGHLLEAWEAGEAAA
jgi:predicted metal-dependent hydrolase